MAFWTREAGDEPKVLPGSPAPFWAGQTLPILGLCGRSCAGLVLRAAAHAGSADERFEVLVVGAAGDTLLPLGPYPEHEVVATWRALSAASGLPILFETVEGERKALSGQIGRVQLGETCARRRRPLAGRRPRFLMRRKTGCLPLSPRIFREREIFGTGI